MFGAQSTDALTPRGKVQVRVNAPNATAVKLNFWSGPKLDTAKQPDGYWMVTTSTTRARIILHAANRWGGRERSKHARVFRRWPPGKRRRGPPELGSTITRAGRASWAMREVWYFSKVTGSWRGRSRTRRRSTTTSGTAYVPRTLYQHGACEERRVGPARDARTLSFTTCSLRENCKPMIVVMAYGYAARAGQPLSVFYEQAGGDRLNAQRHVGYGVDLRRRCDAGG